MKVIKRRSYKEPQCSVICIKTESLLNNASGNAALFSQVNLQEMQSKITFGTIWKKIHK